MAVTAGGLADGVRSLRLSRRAVCVHSSLGSFGRVDGGASAVLDALKSEGCTVLVPSFSSIFAVPPPSGRRPPQNGCDYDLLARMQSVSPGPYTSESNEINPTMGAIPAAVLQQPGRVRGDHPLCSFTGVGPLASELLSGQRPLDEMAPLRRLAAVDGVVLLMGVELTAMTLLHLAEQQAGRRLFRRWAAGVDGATIECEHAGCSAGFGDFAPVLADLARETQVGESRWRMFPAQEALDSAADAIRRDPSITHCSDPTCGRCNDAIAGGPRVGQF